MIDQNGLAAYTVAAAWAQATKKDLYGTAFGDYIGFPPGVTINQIEIRFLRDSEWRPVKGARHMFEAVVDMYLVTAEISKWQGDMRKVVFKVVSQERAQEPPPAPAMKAVGEIEARLAELKTDRDRVRKGDWLGYARVDLMIDTLEWVLNTGKYAPRQA